MVNNKDKTDNFDRRFKMMIAGTGLLIAVSVLIYVARGVLSPKTNYQYCYEKCLGLGKPTVNGTCEKIVI